MSTNADRERELWRLNEQVHQARFPKDKIPGWETGDGLPRYIKDGRVGIVSDYARSLDACTPLMDEVKDARLMIHFWHFGDNLCGLWDERAGMYATEPQVGKDAEAFIRCYLAWKEKANASKNTTPTN
mgnify:CR=1 FL=1